jgi:hypothetical protein
MALALACTVGTAFTASLTFFGAGAVGSQSLPWPAFTAGPQTYDDPTSPTQVTFTITPTAGQSRARTGGTAWSDCTRTANADEWTCPVTGGTSGFEWIATP